MKPGDIVLTPLPQSDGIVKPRPAVVLALLPPFDDALACGITTQLRHAVSGFDEFMEPVGRFPGIEGKRTDPVKIVRLQCCIDGSTFEERLSQLDEMLVRENAEDGPWIYRVPPALCEVLASASAADLDRHGRAWAATEEWKLDGGTPAEIVPYLGQIAQLASRAKAEQVSLFIWTSL